MSGVRAGPPPALCPWFSEVSVEGGGVDAWPLAPRGLAPAPSWELSVHLSGSLPGRGLHPILRMRTLRLREVK